MTFFRLFRFYRKGGAGITRALARAWATARR
jgi:hypothetical protein